MVITLAAIVLLSGLWYWHGSGGDKPILAQPAAMAPLSAPATDPSPDGAARRGEASPPGGTEGAIIPSSAPAGTTTLPMLGVAVDTERPVTAADLQLAKRHQAMATISGQIGDAAAKASNPIVAPASMVPTEGETTGADDHAQADAAGGPAYASRSTQLDLPPATVGPLSLRLAAANGDPSAEFEVGARLAEGKGTAQNFKEAAKWYQLSADRGFAQAQYRLGTLYERGLGLKPDRAQAAGLVPARCRSGQHQGHAQSCGAERQPER